MQTINSDNKYLYNGKELQDDKLNGVKLDWYDYGARFYEPSLGRWHVPDLITETVPGINPYHYCYDNPIRYRDLFGLDGHDPNTDMWGRQKYDENGMYIPPPDRPSLNNYGNTMYGHYEDQFTGYYSASHYETGYMKDREYNKVKEVYEDLSPIYKSKWVWDTEYQNCPVAEAYYHNGETSTVTKASIGFGLTTSAAQAGWKVVNNEYMRQAAINNVLANSDEVVLALKVPKSLKIIGTYGGLPFAVYGAIDINRQYKNGEIDNTTMWIEQTSNGIAGLPVIGTGWSIGWEAGRFITNIPGYHENVRVPVQKFLGIRK